MLSLVLQFALSKLGDSEGVPSTLFFLEDKTGPRQHQHCDFSKWPSAPMKRCHAERHAVEFSWNCTLTGAEINYLKEITPLGCSKTDFLSYSGSYGLTNNVLMSFSNLIYIAHHESRTAVIPTGVEDYFSIPEFFDLTALKQHVCLIDEKDIPKGAKLHKSKNAGQFFKGKVGNLGRQMRLLMLKLIFGNPKPKLKQAVERFYREVLMKGKDRIQSGMGYAAVHHRNLKGLRKECVPWLSECLEEKNTLSVTVKPVKVQLLDLLL